MVDKGTSSRRRIGVFVLLVLVLGLGLLLIIAWNDNSDEKTTPKNRGTIDSEMENQPQTENEQQIKITADSPTRIAAIGDQPLDLGTTPIIFEPPKWGYWEVVGFDPQSTKQQFATKNLSDNQATSVHFSFEDSQAWVNPLAIFNGAITQALVVNNGSLLGIKPTNRTLQTIGLVNNNFPQLKSIQTIVWHDQQNYLYLKFNGQLTLVGPDGGWTIDEVKSLAGNTNWGAWIKSGGQVEIWDWVKQQRLETGIENQNASDVFIGQQNLYLFSRNQDHNEPSDGVEHTHSGGQVEIYPLKDYQLDQKFLVHEVPQAMAEIGLYSFWNIRGNLYAIYNQSGEAINDLIFNRQLVDLITGQDSFGQPIIYLLIESGEIWDFKLERGTYNLVGRAPNPADWPQGHAIVDSLVQKNDLLYFGFDWGEETRIQQTFRVRLAGN